MDLELDLKECICLSLSGSKLNATTNHTNKAWLQSLSSCKAHPLHNQLSQSHELVQYIHGTIWRLSEMFWVRIELVTSEDRDQEMHLVNHLSYVTTIKHHQLPNPHEWKFHNCHKKKFVHNRTSDCFNDIRTITTFFW